MDKHNDHDKRASIHDVCSGWGEGGSQKSRQKKHNQLICDSDKEGVKKSENFADVIYGSTLTRKYNFVTDGLKPHFTSPSQE